MKTLKRLVAILGGGIVGLFLLVYGVREFLQTKSLQSKGKTTIGEVTDSEERSGRRGRRKYYITVSYKPEEGQPVTSESRVSKLLFDEANSSKKMNVTYLPSDPTVCRFGTEVKTDFVNIGIGALVLGFAAFSAVRGSTD